MIDDDFCCKIIFFSKADYQLMTYVVFRAISCKPALSIAGM